MKKTLLILFSLVTLCGYSQIVAKTDSFTFYQARIETFDIVRNDSFPLGDSICITLLDSPVHFTAIDCRHVRYQSDSSFTGVETCRYQLCDTAMLCDTAAIVVIIIPDNGYHYIPMPTSAVRAAWNGFEEGMENGTTFRQYT